MAQMNLAFAFLLLFCQNAAAAQGAGSCGKTDWTQAFGASSPPAQLKRDPVQEKILRCMDEHVSKCTWGEVTFTDSPMGWIKYKITRVTSDKCEIEFWSKRHSKKPLLCTVKTAFIKESEKQKHAQGLFVEIASQLELVRGLNQPSNDIACEKNTVPLGKRSLRRKK